MELTKIMTFPKHSAYYFLLSVIIFASIFLSGLSIYFLLVVYESLFTIPILIVVFRIKRIRFQILFIVVACLTQVIIDQIFAYNSKTSATVGFDYISIDGYLTLFGVIYNYSIHLVVAFVAYAIYLVVLYVRSRKSNGRN